MNPCPFSKFQLKFLCRSISPWWLIFSLSFPGCFFFLFLALVWPVLCTLLFLLPRNMCTWRGKYLLLSLLQGLRHPFCLVHEFLYFKPVSVNIRCWFVFHPFLGGDAQWVIRPCEAMGEIHLFQLLIILFTWCPAIANKRTNLGFHPELRLLLCCYEVYFICIDHFPDIL